METGGMVAVVQGLRDSGLTVTLLDGPKQYTLMPESAPHPKSPRLRSNPSVNSASKHQQCGAGGCTGSSTFERCHRENGVQATDGRYASTYKMMHCHVSPTSPPQNVTEFPPQRPEVIPGHSNFVVGGYGSGESFSQAKKSSSFKGAMCWPDRGSVCTSKPSVQPDAFANSLRKYPSISPERSTEIVERLISFTQAKNLNRNANRCACSPTRNSLSSESSKQTYVVEANVPRTDAPKYQPDVAKKKNERRNNDSPVRDRARNVFEDHDYGDRALFCNDNDVRCFRDFSRRVREGFRNMNKQETNIQMPKGSSSIQKEQYDYDFDYRRILEHTSNNSVNMEIQAAAQMESKEILTLPRIVPMQRTVATAISVASNSDTGLETRMNFAHTSKSYTRLSRKCSSKSIQAKMSLVEIKIASSSMEIRNNDLFSNKRNNTKNKDELGSPKKNIKEEILKVLENFNGNFEYVSEVKCEIEPKIKNRRKNEDGTSFIHRGKWKLRKSFSDNMCLYSDSCVDLIGCDYGKSINESLNKCINIQGCDFKTTYERHVLQDVDIIERGNDSKETNEACIKDTYINDIFPEKQMIRKGKHMKNNNINCKTDCVPNNRRKNKNNLETVTINQKELRNLIDLDILAFTEKYRLNITTESLHDLREELMNLFKIDVKDISIFNKNYVTKGVKHILQDRGFIKNHALYLSNILIEHWEEFSIENNFSVKLPNTKSDTFIILPNITQNSSKFQQYGNNSSKHDLSSNDLSQKDIDTDVNVYLNKISNEIKNWLSNLNLPEMKDSELQEAMINDLANDIVDRKKYLELNPLNEISEASELEHLKYQIFKWVYKLTDGSNMTPVENANELMRRIQSVPVPIFSMPRRKLSAQNMSNQDLMLEPSNQRINAIEPSNYGASSTRRLSSPAPLCCKRETCKRNKESQNAAKEPVNEVITTARRMSSPGKLLTAGSQTITINVPKKEDTFKQFSGAIRIKDSKNEINKPHIYVQQDNVNTTNKDVSDKYKFDDDYIKYVKDWVGNIPIPVHNAEDEIPANTVREDIYNSFLKFVSKIKSEPNTFKDRFLLEDILDDEIEKLLGNIPQSPELKSRKHFLKVQLIEKTIDFFKASYKQELVESVKGILPELKENKSEDSDVLQLYEDLQILNIVEDFIIYSGYQNEDRAMSEAYRNKLLKHAESFIDELKANHKMALKNIDAKLYLDNILDTLKAVPKPNTENIQEEADEILLGLEIDTWFSELRLIHDNNDYVEQLNRRRLRNNLIKQILDIERGIGNTEYSVDSNLKHEISQFLENMPLQEGQRMNMNLMADKLIEQLKNRPKLVRNYTKKVSYEPDYDGFIRNMPLCSTHIGQPRDLDDTDNQNIISFSNKSIQTDFPSELTFGGPILGDLRPSPESRKNHDSSQHMPQYESFDDGRPISSSHRDDFEPQWYTLQESSQEHPQTNSVPNQNSRSATSQLYNRQHHANTPEEASHYRVPPGECQEFVIPQQYYKESSFNDNSDYQSIRQHSRKTSPKRVSMDRSPLSGNQYQEPMRRQDNYSTDQRLPNSYVPAENTLQGREGLDRNQHNMRSDLTLSPRQMPYCSTSLKSPDRYEYIPHQSSGRQEVTEDRSSPQSNQNIFYRSTDKEGIKRTIERNRSMEENLDRSIPPKKFIGYYIPPGYIPLRRDKKHASGRSMDRKYREDSDDDDDDEGELHCRCVDKMWKSKRRLRHCPFHEHNGYPMCISTPYFYPYFYYER